MIESPLGRPPHRASILRSFEESRVSEFPKENSSKDIPLSLQGGISFGALASEGFLILYVVLEMGGNSAELSA